MCETQLPGQTPALALALASAGRGYCTYLYVSADLLREVRQVYYIVDPVCIHLHVHFACTMYTTRTRARP